MNEDRTKGCSHDAQRTPNRSVKLNPSARAGLAKKLLTSLEALSEAEVERLWVEEAERRNEQMRRRPLLSREAAEDVIRDARARGLR